MGWKPDEFWSSTPVEFSLATDGFRRRREFQRRESAWGIANLLTVWTQRPVTIDELLGKASEETEGPVLLDAANAVAFYRDHARRLLHQASIDPGA